MVLEKKPNIQLAQWQLEKAKVKKQALQSGLLRMNLTS
jgi:hypothetical protein